MRLIYDRPDHSEIAVRHIVFKAGRVSADIREPIARDLIAQPHLHIRAATAAEIAAADGTASAGKKQKTAAAQRGAAHAAGNPNDDRGRDAASEETTP